jgi:hypothetical protein
MSFQGGGLWNNAKPVISTETQNLLKGKQNDFTTFIISLNNNETLFKSIVMMKESKLTNFQQRTLNSSARSKN